MTIGKEKKMKCPICDEELTKKYEHCVEHWVEESSYQCKYRHYSETYVYGEYFVKIGDFEASYSYSTPKSHELFDGIKALISIYRK